MNDGSGDIHERLVRAYRLLGEAGWHAVDGRLLDTAGRPLRFELLLQGQGLERALLPFQRNLARIGIDMRLRQVDASQYIERIRARDYDMIVSSFSQSIRRAMSSTASGIPPATPIPAATTTSA